MHHSKLPLRTWFEAIRLLATHSDGISAEQVQGQLDLGSYKTAWLLLMKLRRAMVDPQRTLFQELVEVDETEVSAPSMTQVWPSQTSGSCSSSARKAE